MLTPIATTLFLLPADVAGVSDRTRALAFVLLSTDVTGLMTKLLVNKWNVT